ncbi:MAG: magnesium/cobalt efflux protein [Rhodospirillaceae bacterium]|nr:magnesium/cobalt efflux protein [Rhodospirillaceae bacterium]
MTDLSRNDKTVSATDAGTSGGGWFGQWLRGLFGGRNGENSVRETIGELIEETGDEATPINPDEGELIANILKLHDLTAEDVMVPRADIVATDQDCELDALADLMSREAHSRIPLYQSHLDKVVGFVHIKDVLATMRSSPGLAVRELTREILFAAPSVRVLDLLLEMRAQRTHMAIVVDEFGGVDGLVTIEDLVEEIVGEIEDEHDEEGLLIRRDPDGSIFADARAEIEDLEAMIGPFMEDSEREEIYTLGGVVFSIVDRVPRRSEVVTHASGVEFIVVDADPRRIKRLRIRDQRPAGPDP